jgi:hypothetical protein
VEPALDNDHSLVVAFAGNRVDDAVFMVDAP